MPLPALSDHSKGLLITFVGGFALSLDIPLVRLSQGSLWPVLGLRSVVTFLVAMVGWLLIRRMTQSRPRLLPGPMAAVAALLYGLSSVTFLGAVFYTTTANVVFIVAFTPMFAALLSWLVMKERLAVSTFITMAAMAIGVGIIVRDGFAGGHVIGDLLAAVTALMLAGALTVGRASGQPMGFVPLVATLLPAIVGLVMSQPGMTASASIAHPFWVILDGGVLLPLAFWCLATGPRYLTAPEVAMFYLLETVLAPIWVWLVFSEVPTRPTLIGGFVLIMALVLHSAWQSRQKSVHAV